MKKLAIASIFALAGCAHPGEPQSTAEKLVRLPALILIYGLANTSGPYSSTVDTGSGTYDVRGSCTFGSCASTVRKR